MPAENAPGSTPEAASPPPEASLPRISVQSLIGPDGIAGPERFREFLRAASKQCRRLVDCETVRIWVVRSGGRRLVAWDFPDGSGAPRELRRNRAEGLVGWVLRTGESLRLAAGEPRPSGLVGDPERDRSALVLPLFRSTRVRPGSTEAFAVIECQGRNGGAFTSADFDRL